MLKYAGFFVSLTSFRAASTLLAMVTFPFLLHQIGPVAYGSWAFVLAMGGFAGVVANPGINTYLGREVAAQRLGARRLIQQVITVRLILAFLVAIFLSGYACFVEPNVGTKNLIFYYLIPVTMLGAFTFDGIFNANELFYQISFLSFFDQLIFFLSILLFVGAGNLVGNIITLFIGWWILTKKGFSCLPMFTLSEQINILKKSYVYGISSVFSQIYNRAGHVIVRLWLGDLALGFYASAVRSVEIILGFLRVIPQPLSPKIIKLIASGGDYHKWIALSFRLVLWVVLPCILGGWIFADDIVALVMGKEYLSAAPVFKILLFVLLSGTMASFFSGLSICFSKPNVYLRGVISGAVFGVLGYTIFIPILREIGAGVGYVLGELGVASMAYFGVRERIQLNFQREEIFKFAGILIFMLVLSLVVKKNTHIHHVIYSILIVGVCYCFVMAFHVRKMILTYKN